ncbi:MAG TPA: hypothetical protein VF698_18850 [Thermoanaerobaculia bacterium]
MLDEAVETVTLAGAPWAGLLVAATLPFRLAQVWFLDRLLEVGADASRYGNVLAEAADVTMLCFAIALAGRAVYARACGLAITSRGIPGREAWRVPAAALAAYFLTMAFGVLITAAVALTVFGLALVSVYNGLAIGTMELNDRVGLFAPFRTLRRRASLKIPLVLTFVLFCATIAAWANLVMGTYLLMTMSGAAGVAELPRAAALFSPSNRVFLLLTAAGALLAVEPFRIAAYVVFIRKLGSEERGDDLRTWFRELQRAS